MKNVILKPCPFCGGEAKLQEDMWPRFVYCTVCNARTREMVRWKLAAIDAIRAVEEPRLSEVLELYYIDGMTWDKVAQRMGLDQRWVYRLHGRALMCVKVPEGVDQHGNV